MFTKFSTIESGVKPFLVAHPEYRFFVGLERQNRARTFYVYLDAPSFVSDFAASRGTYHEYVVPASPVKLYFDVDDKRKRDGWEDLLLKIKSCVAGALGRDPEMCVLDASIESKFSAHLVFPDVGFDCATSLSVFARTVHTQLDRDDRVDMQVYTESSLVYKSLRVPYCASYGKTNVLRPRGGPHDFDLAWFLKTLVTHDVPTDVISLAVPDRMYTPQEFEEDVDPAHARALSNVERFIRISWCLSHVDTKQRLNAKTGVWVWHVRPGLWCPIKKRRHAHNNTMIRGTLVGGSYVKLETFCLDEQCRQWTENRDHDWTRIALA